jgi:hypothetical protein
LYQLQIEKKATAAVIKPITTHASYASKKKVLQREATDIMFKSESKGVLFFGEQEASKRKRESRSLDDNVGL